MCLLQFQLKQRFPQPPFYFRFQSHGSSRNPIIVHSLSFDKQGYSSIPLWIRTANAVLTGAVRRSSKRQFD
jgi:hypothetical protein